jgi:hypothetical protein
VGDRQREHRVGPPQHLTHRFYYPHPRPVCQTSDAM